MVMIRRWTELILLQETVKRKSISRSGRAGDEDDAVRLGEERLHRPGVFRAKIKSLKTERLLLIPTQKTQADRFAVDRWDGGNANVNLLVGGFQIDPAILWETALRDIHVRHDFQTRDDGRLEQAQLRRDGDLVRMPSMR